MNLSQNLVRKYSQMSKTQLSLFELIKIKLTVLLRVVAFFFVCFPEHSYSQVLFFQISDSHSAAEEAIIFAKTVFKKRAEVLETLEPHEARKLTTLIQVNGDFSGTSPYVAWARREKRLGREHPLLLDGWFGIRLLEALAEDGFVIVKSNGNHEAMDFGGDEGKRVFLKQESYFKSRIRNLKVLPEINKSYQLLMGNVTLTDDVAGKGLFAAYRDIKMRDGNVYRFVGGVLDRFFIKVYNEYIKSPEEEFNRKTHMYREVEGLKSYTRRMIAKAKKDGITRVVFQYHDDYTKIEPIISELNSELSGLDMVLFQAGHDHLARVMEFPEAGTKGRLYLTDSGSNFNIVMGEFSPEGRVRNKAIKGMGPVSFLIDDPHNQRSSSPEQRDQRSYTHGYSIPKGTATAKLIQELAAEVEIGKPWLKGTHQRDGKTVMTPYIPYHKRHLTKEGKRLVLGDMFAGAFRRAGLHEIQADAKLPQGFPVIGMVNSSAYRSDYPFGEEGKLVPVTTEMFLRIAPEDVSNIVLVTGAQLKNLYQSTRNFRIQKEGKFSPQLSNLIRSKAITPKGIDGVEIPQFTLEYYSSAKSEYQEIPDDGLVWVIMDGFFYRNEMMIEAFKHVFGRYDSKTHLYDRVRVWSGDEIFEKDAPGISEDPMAWRPVEIKFRTNESALIQNILIDNMIDEFADRADLFKKWHEDSLTGKCSRVFED